MSLQNLDVLEPMLGEISLGTGNVVLPYGTYPFIELRQAVMRLAASLVPIEHHNDHIEQVLRAKTGLQVFITFLAATDCVLNDEDLFGGVERKLHQHATELLARDSAGRTPDVDRSVLGIKYLYSIISGYRSCVLRVDTNFTDLGELLGRDDLSEAELPNASTMD